MSKEHKNDLRLFLMFGFLLGFITCGLIATLCLIFAPIKPSEPEIWVVHRCAPCEEWRRLYDIEREMMESLEWPMGAIPEYDEDCEWEPENAFWNRLVQARLYSDALEYNIDPLFVTAIAYVESRYNQATIGAKGEIGVMQIWPGWPQLLDVDLDLHIITDNILMGILILDYYQNYLGITDLHYLAKAYNGNEGYARTLRERGIMTTEYSRKVMAKYEELLNRSII